MFFSSCFVWYTLNSENWCPWEYFRIIYLNFTLGCWTTRSSYSSSFYYVFSSLLFSVLYCILWETFSILFSNFIELHNSVILLFISKGSFCCWMFLFKKNHYYFHICFMVAVSYFSGEYQFSGSLVLFCLLLPHHARAFLFIWFLPFLVEAFSRRR